jgi:hypothetical protein
MGGLEAQIRDVVPAERWTREKLLTAKVAKKGREGRKEQKCCLAIFADFLGELCG